MHTVMGMETRRVTKRPERGAGARPLLRMLPALVLAAAGSCFAQTVTVTPTFDTNAERTTKTQTTAARTSRRGRATPAVANAR